LFHDSAPTEHWQPTLPPDQELMQNRSKRASGSLDGKI
jgi:hypothetical protein